MDIPIRPSTTRCMTPKYGAIPQDTCMRPIPNFMSGACPLLNCNNGTLNGNLCYNALLIMHPGGIPNVRKKPFIAENSHADPAQSFWALGEPDHAQSRRAPKKS